jgi:hypothetical protein
LRRAPIPDNPGNRRSVPIRAAGIQMRPPPWLFRDVHRRPAQCLLCSCSRNDGSEAFTKCRQSLQSVDLVGSRESVNVFVINGL